MASWQVGGMPWLWLPQQCWESNQDLNVDKYPKNLFMDDSKSKLCCLCHKHVGKNVRKVGIANLQFVGCCGHVASVLRYPSYQRNQTGEVLSETNYCGTVNVLKLQTHIWIPIKEEEIPVKSLYARWVSDFLYKLSAKVHQHLFHFFFQKMTLYGISSFLVTILLWQHFVIRQDRYLQLNARRISDFF